MAVLENGAVETVHVQVGTDLYIFALDQILPNNGETFAKVMGLPEVAGSAQGMGLETVWWDTTNEPVMTSMDPEDLQRRANLARSLGYNGPVAEPTEEQLKEKLIVKVERKSRKPRRT